MNSPRLSLCTIGPKQTNVGSRPGTSCRPSSALILNFQKCSLCMSEYHFLQVKEAFLTKSWKESLERIDSKISFGSNSITALTKISSKLMVSSTGSVFLASCVSIILPIYRIFSSSKLSMRIGSQTCSLKG
ncbi:hypothetical protein BpHYR1_046550 [Brachionus plicatilis]|uniref:Uncharacterized protein n=1 Tax=Brachionus plicatilis TaxID=10195 RepID=A0A3M7RRA4_BRAPC|nr:hypothetical protein BpHYR1_046550 [Brachionus plicatilis]